jgi:DNA helicase-2/ATP-dependent DNA helicase PcrA
LTNILVPRPRARRPRQSSLVDVPLDAAQRGAIQLPAGRALLVLGEAGHGKTTVLLHRVAHVWRGSSSPLRAAVVVPSEGLARLLQPLLRRLGVDVEVLTYDRWAAAQARRAFRGLPRESESTPPSVMRIKRDPALRIALKELAKREPGRINDDVDAPTRRTRRHAIRGDLQHLFGDRILLERVARGSKSALARGIEDVLERTKVQFEATTEDQWAHVVDRQRLVAVDRRAIDDGTATGHVNTIDVEDYAVLFELDRARAARRRQPPTPPRAYDLLAIDEAQELAPLELSLLGRSLAPEGTLVVAGDADQQIDATTTFPGWDPAMRELGRPQHAVVSLELGYRCPPSVVALARGILGKPAPAHERTAAASGARAAFVVFADERALATGLGSELSALLRRDPAASVAILCRSPRTARRLAPLLAGHVPTRIVFDGRFLPRGPVQITTVDEVRGLEFDVVIVPDANAGMYPDDAASRRTMYVAVTRARHQVAVACVGERSPWVPWPLPSEPSHPT